MRHNESESEGRFSAAVEHGRLTAMVRRAWQVFVLEKKPRCLTHFGQPTYHGPEGHCCPLGFFIPRAYGLTPWQNMMTIGELIHTRREVRDCFADVKMEHLKALQTCHDEGQNPYKMALLLRKFAEERNLTFKD